MNTIVAISTAPATGGIGIIRLSGEKAFDIVLKIFKSNKIKKIEDIKKNHIYYGHIYDKKQLLDEVMVSFFKAPYSYTRENVVEINSHGGIVVMKKILDLVIENGAVPASPGEFTKRAFINGRIDLTQVEAVATIIEANSEEELKASNRILEGRLQDKINIAKEKILEILSNIAVNIDYPEYETPEVDNKKIKENLEFVLEEFKNLEKNFDIGDKIREGIKVAIIGKPNSGKSSLLNYILNSERAIVTNIAGTTRDTIEENINIEGMPVRIVDTAGIRETDEIIEKIGIERSIKAANEADIIIAIFDSSEKLNDDDFKILEIAKKKQSIIVLNKIDLTKKIEEEKLKIKDILKISIYKKEGVDQLLNELSKKIREMKNSKDQSSVVIIHERQKNIIEEIIKLTIKAIEEIEKIPMDILSTSIENIYEKIAEITGENVKEELLNDVFSKFCLGK